MRNPGKYGGRGHVNWDFIFILFHEPKFPHPSGRQYQLAICFSLFFFIYLEGMALWFLFYRKHKNKLSWYATALILTLCPLIMAGEGLDFCMRVSIAPLFQLMVWSGMGLADRKWLLRPLLIGMLVIGSLTPLYEINRSIYRTDDYLLHRIEYDQQPRTTPHEAVIPPIRWEHDHPYTLLADDYITVANFSKEQVNFIGDINNSLIGKYFFKQRK